MSDSSTLRPLERRVLAMRDSGMSTEEIARRFRRSPAHIERVMELASLPGRTGAGDSNRGGLRALERRVLHLRNGGLGHDEIAKRFRRSPAHIRRVEGMALYKTSVRLLTGDA